MNLTIKTDFYEILIYIPLLHGFFHLAHFKTAQQVFYVSGLKRNAQMKL